MKLDIERLRRAGQYFGVFCFWTGIGALMVSLPPYGSLLVSVAAVLWGCWMLAKR